MVNKKRKKKKRRFGQICLNLYCPLLHHCKPLSPQDFAELQSTETELESFYFQQIIAYPTFTKTFPSICYNAIFFLTFAHNDDYACSLAIIHGTNITILEPFYISAPYKERRCTPLVELDAGE